MKIVTWNVNSIRTRLPRLLALLERHRPDVVCLQEVKVEADGFPGEEIAAAGYRSEVHGQKAYNGVAILSRRPLTEVSRGFPGDPVPGEARVLGATVEGLRILDLYVVNGEAPGSEKYATKLRWLDAFADWLAAEHDSASPLLLVGDFNIAPEDRDVHDPERWRGKIHCSDDERVRLRRLLDWGLVDLLRIDREEAGIYTWWDYRMGAFHRGWGLRIDLALGTGAIARRYRGTGIDREERKPTSGEGKPSDHAPVLVTLEG